MAKVYTGLSVIYISRKFYKRTKFKKEKTLIECLLGRLGLN